MLAEKFFLVLETLRSHALDDRPEIVTSRAQAAAALEVAKGLLHKAPAPGHRDWKRSYVAGPACTCARQRAKAFL